MNGFECFGFAHYYQNSWMAPYPTTTVTTAVRKHCNIQPAGVKLGESISLTGGQGSLCTSTAGCGGYGAMRFLEIFSTDFVFGIGSKWCQRKNQLALTRRSSMYSHLPRHLYTFGDNVKHIIYEEFTRISQDFFKHISRLGNMLNSYLLWWVT